MANLREVGGRLERAERSFEVRLHLAPDRPGRPRILVRVEVGRATGVILLEGRPHDPVLAGENRERTERCLDRGPDHHQIGGQGKGR